MRPRRRYILCALLCIFTLASVPFAVVYVRTIRPHRSLARLLNGSEQVAIESVRLEGNGREITCTNPEIVRLLTDAFRQARPVSEFSLGRSYDIIIDMGSHGSWTTGVHAGLEGNSFVIYIWGSLIEEVTTFSDPQDYLISMPTADSDLVKQLFDAMRGEHQGTIVID
ncbi:MAG: hypothetical protein JXB13_15000 [Phycisphaerae bacterium]|nr:hypothetical protein [Phycisphaerae bacterium]